MTNIESYSLSSEHRLLLKTAASKVENWSEYLLTDEQADFLVFVLRSAANGRDFETVLSRLLQLARSLGGVEHDLRCDSSLCHPDCAVARWMEMEL